MSETLTAPAKSAPMHAGLSDVQMLAQVEKWMETIRDINREQQTEPTFRVRLRPAASATK